MSSMANPSHTDSTSVLIIAWGNPQRSDDGAGLVLAQSLAPLLENGGCRTRLICVHQLVPELVLDMADEAVGAVVFIDTECSPPNASREHQIHIRMLRFPLARASLTHNLSPQTLLFYTQELYHRFPTAWLVTIPGVEFGHGTEFSPVVQALLADLEEVGRQLLRNVLSTGA